MSSAKSGAVIHRNVAVIACDTLATLQETLHRLEDLAIDAVQVGDRHVILPAREVEQVLERLKEHGQFPRLVGQGPAGPSVASASGAEGPDRAAGDQE